MSDRVLPTRSLLVTIVSVSVCNVCVDAIQIELPIGCVQDGLCYHLSVAVLGLNVLVLVLA